MDFVMFQFTRYSRVSVLKTSETQVFKNIA